MRHKGCACAVRVTVLGLCVCLSLDTCSCTTGYQAAYELYKRVQNNVSLNNNKKVVFLKKRLHRTLMAQPFNKRYRACVIIEGLH